MSSTHVFDVILNGVSIPIRVDSWGDFEADLQGNRYTDHTYEGLKTKLSRASKKAVVSVSVPFTQIDANGHVRHGTATGIHSGNGNVLVEYANGEKMQKGASYGSRGGAYKPLSNQDLAEWRHLEEAFEAASKARRAWDEAHRLDLKQVVRDEIEAAAKEQEA